MPVLNRDVGVVGGHGVVRSGHQQCLKGQKYPALLCDCNGAKLSGVKLSYNRVRQLKKVGWLGNANHPTDRHGLVLEMLMHLKSTYNDFP